MSALPISANAVIYGDINNDGNANDITITMDQDTPLFTLDTDGVSLEHSANIDSDIDEAFGVANSLLGTIPVLADNASFVNSGNILVIGTLGPNSDRATAVYVDGDDFTFTNSIDGSIVTTGRFGIHARDFDENFEFLDIFTTVINDGYLEAGDDAIRLYTGSILNTGDIVSTGTFDLDGDGTAFTPGYVSDGISILGPSGGAGNDNLAGEAGNDTLNGGADNDTIDGGNGEDIIDGGAGNDTLRGGGDNDTIDGGVGLDTISAGIGDDTVHGGGNNDTILGQGGADILYGDGGADTLRGGSGNDTLHGGDAGDLLFGQGNNDILYGEGGNDSLSGAAGSDQLFGGDGNDVLNGSIGADRLDGGTGNDILHGGGADGARDTFVFAVGYEQDRINGFDQAGNDRLELDDALWAAAGSLTGQEVVDMFGSLNATGSILTLDFGNGDILEVQNGAGIDMDTFGADILVI